MQEVLFCTIMYEWLLEQNDTRGVIMSKITYECQSEQSYGRSTFRENDSCYFEYKFSFAELN